MIIICVMHDAYLLLIIKKNINSILISYTKCSFMIICKYSILECISLEE